jgi:Tfp pilus assembly protein PilV
MPRPRCTNRPGVSLPEVLVAAVLLAIGVSGCLAAVATALRFRTMALTREAMAAASQARLAWFDASGCALADTVVRSAANAALTERWEVRRDSSVVRFDGVTSASHAGRPMRLAIATVKRCD